jgi:ubiquitin C-terminal hydrolase
MIYSEEEHKVIKHYTYRDALPKLTFTKSTNTNVFKNPVNYFIISIVRETDNFNRNTKFLENLPERIHSYGKTLELVSAIVHYGANQLHGHYVCYFKCGSNWYIMDNTNENITNYAPFNIRNHEIMTRCRMLVYM